MRVLVVEDDLGIAQSIQQELIEVGYVVDVASDGESGLHYATRAEYDIIILDIMLPKLVDTSLQIASAQSLLYINSNHGLVFQKTPKQLIVANRLSHVGLAARLISHIGRVVDGFG